jgi:hypothetical protein
MSGVRPERLVQLARRFRSYSYGNEVVYPWRIPGVSVEVQTKGHPPAELQTNCCCFVEALLVRAFWERDQRLRLTKNFHKAFMAIGDHYGPVHASIELGFADPVQPSTYPDHPWLVCQGWNEDFSRGHTFFLVKTEAGGRVLVLESNNAYAVRGVGWRGLGGLDNFPNPPDAPKWWTWDKLLIRYPNLRAAAIRLDG